MKLHGSTGIVFAWAATMLLQAMAMPKACACWVDWSVPRDYFDGVNEGGFVSYWDEIGDIDIGENEKFPLVIGFQSDRERSSPYLGYGWVMPLLESYMIQKSENTFEIMKPGGYTSGFGRDPKNPSLIEGVKGWKGRIEGDTIKVWADCGWSLTYTRGWLTAIGTPKGKNIVVNRNPQGVANDVTLDGRVLLRAKRGAGGIVEGFELSEGKVIALEQAEKPRLQVVEGKCVVAAKDLSVGKIRMVDGTEKVFDYEPTTSLQPTLKIRKTESQLREIVWDPMSRLIVSDENWKYVIKQGQPGEKNVAINRTNSRGQAEFWHYDPVNGKDTKLDVNGVKRIKTWFTSGPLAGKIRKEEVYDNDKLISGRTFSYTEQAKLIRDTLTKPAYANGKSATPDRTIITTYDDSGNMVSRSINGVEKIRKIYDAKGRIKSIVNGSLEESTVYSSEDEWSKIISDLSLPSEMMNIINNATKVVIKPATAGKFYSFRNNENFTLLMLTPSRKTHIYSAK